MTGLAFPGPPNFAQMLLLLSHPPVSLSLSTSWSHQRPGERARLTWVEGEGKFYLLLNKTIPLNQAPVFPLFPSLALCTRYPIFSTARLSSLPLNPLVFLTQIRGAHLGNGVNPLSLPQSFVGWWEWDWRSAPPARSEAVGMRCIFKFQLSLCMTLVIETNVTLCINSMGWSEKKTDIGIGF